MFNILSQITLNVKFLRNEEQHCHLPSLVDDFTCVHPKNAFSLTSCQLYFLVPLSSFLAHLLALRSLDCRSISVITAIITSSSVILNWSHIRNIHSIVVTSLELLITKYSIQFQQWWGLQSPATTTVLVTNTITHWY